MFDINKNFITITEIEIVRKWAKDHPIEPVKEEQKQMTLSDLKTGWISELRNGGRRTVFRDITPLLKGGGASDIICNSNRFKWNDLKNYNSDLTCKSGSQYDIMKIYQPSHPYAIQDLEYDFENWTLLWQRKENQNKSIFQDLTERLSWPNVLRVMNEQQYFVRPEGKK